MKEYYNAEDIQKITGVGQTLAYEIIRKLRHRFELEYPTAITIKGKIPIWYFEEQTHCKKEEKE